MSTGFIKLNRDILDSYVFAHPTALKIWIWLLLKARWKDGFSTIDVGNRSLVVEVKRGQMIFGRFKAEQSLDIDGSTIYKWMQKFQDNELINIDSNNRYSIITVCEYDSYDADNFTKEQQESSNVTARGQQEDSNVTHKKKVNKVNKENNKHIMSGEPDNAHLEINAVESVSLQTATKELSDNEKADWVIQFLNEETGKSFRFIKSNRAFIIARLKEKYVGEDFKKVIKFKTEEWRGTENDQYLRPETLFGKKFDGYLQAATARKMKTEIKPRPSFDELNTR